MNLHSLDPAQVRVNGGFIDLPSLTHDRNQLVQLLESKGAKFRGNDCNCPYHQDRTPSAGIFTDADGHWRFKCHSAKCGVGGDFIDLRGRDGITIQEIAQGVQGISPEPKPSTDKKRHESLPAAIKAARFGQKKKYGVAIRADVGPWIYQSADLIPAYAIVRFNIGEDKKSFSQITFDNGAWICEAPGKDRVLYRLPELISSPGPVLIVEGEKCADIASEIMTTTTWSGGANNVKASDWSPLAGREVWVWPDVGAKHVVEEIAKILWAIDSKTVVKRVNHGLTEDGADIEEWRDQQGDDESTESLKAKIEGMLVEVPRPSDGFFETKKRLDEMAAAVNGERAESDTSETYGKITPTPSTVTNGWQPMPLDGLPEEIRQYIEIAAFNKNNEPAAVAITLLAAAGAAIGNSRWVRLKPDWEQPPMLFIADVSYSGTGKTPAFAAGMKFAWNCSKRFAREHKQSVVQWREQVAVAKTENEVRKAAGNETIPLPPKPIRRRFDMSVATTQAITQRLACNPNGMMLYRSELGGLFGTFNQFSSGDDASFYTEIHDGIKLTKDKIGSPDESDDDKEIEVDRPFLAIAGSIQWSKLQKHKTEEHEDSGLFARFLFSATPEREEWKWNEKLIPAEVEAKCQGIFDRLFELKPDASNEPVFVGLMDAAKADAIQFAEEDCNEGKQLAETKGERLAWPKLRTCFGRIALIVHQLHVAAGTPGIVPGRIDEKSMRYAISLSRWFGTQAAIVYNQLAGNSQLAQIDRDRAWLLKWCAEHPKVTVRDFRRCGPSPRPKKGEDSTATIVRLDAMVAAGFAEGDREGGYTPKSRQRPLAIAS